MAAPRHAPTRYGDAAAMPGPEKARQALDARARRSTDRPRQTPDRNAERGGAGNCTVSTLSRNLTVAVRITPCYFGVIERLKA
jgi:hypothetical protein